MKCCICGKEPKQIDEYRIEAKFLRMTPDNYVKREEGTYNAEKDTFCCTDCYIKTGSPKGIAPFEKVSK